jgi:hypothetical protein
MDRDLIFVQNGKAQLHLHPGQTKAWDSLCRFVFIIAGTQSGKTSFGPWWLWREIKRCGEGDYLAVTATYDLFKLKMLPEMQTVFTHYLANEGWTFQASDRVITDGKTRIILRSANAPGGLESATGKAAWIDECGQDDFRLDSWDAIQRRLSLSRGRVLGTTTPYNLGWLKTEVYDRWRRSDPAYQVIQFRSTMNPKFPLEEYERARATLPDWKFQMFYNGQFTRPAGMIYDCFDYDIHVVKPFELKKEWPVYVGIDFGGVNTATIWIAEDFDRGAYYIFQETLEGGMSTAEHVKHAAERAEKKRVVNWAGGAKSEIQQRMDWTSEGLSVNEPLVIDVEAGIDRVYGLLKHKQLFIFDTCRGLIDEIGTYSREIDDMGQATEKIKDKETYHRLDATRYCVQQLDTGAGMVDDPFSNW